MTSLPPDPNQGFQGAGEGQRGEAAFRALETENAALRAFVAMHAGILEDLIQDAEGIRFVVDEKAAYGVAPAMYGETAPYAIGWKHACDAILAELRYAAKKIRTV